MNKISSKTLGIIKYVYLVAFFALLSGLFYPLINKTSFFDVVIGILVLFLGLTGGILLYQTTKSKNRREIFLSIGFTLIFISLIGIFVISGVI